MNFRTTAPALVVLCVLALADWALTMDALYMKAVYEANPVMRWMAVAAPWESLALKLLVVGLGGAFIAWTGRYTKWAGIALCGLVAVYAFVVVYQCLARLYFL